MNTLYFPLGVINYLEKLGDLGPAFALVGGVLMVCMIIFSIMSEKARWVIFALLCFFASIERAERTVYFNLQMSPVMQTLSSYSRPITVGLLIVMFCGAIFSKSQVRQHLLNGPIIALFAFQLLICVNYFVGGAVERGMLTPLVYLMMFVGISRGLGNSMNSLQDCRYAVWAIVITCALLVLSTMFELAVRPGAVVPNGRLFGTMRNPQAAGSTLALSITALTFLIISAGGIKTGLAKVLLLGLTAIALIFLMWTGSRTALLTLVVGLLFMFYDRLSSFAWIGAVVSLSLYFLASTFGEAFETSRRLVDTHDTRSEVWGRMIQTFFDNPAFGTGMTMSTAGESSYLGTAALMGIPGVLIMGIFVFTVIRLCFKLLKLRHLLGQESLLANLVVSGLAALLAASFFDGYLLGSTTYHIFFLYLYLSIGACLVELAEREQASRAYQSAAYESHMMAHQAQLQAGPT